MAARAPGAPMGGGESPGGNERGPMPALRTTHASRALLTRVIDDLTELVQTVEAKKHRSVYQRLIDALKAVDHVAPWSPDEPEHLQKPLPRPSSDASYDFGRGEGEFEPGNGQARGRHGSPS